MRALNLKQHTVLKGFFIILVLSLWISSASLVHAAEIPKFSELTKQLEDAGLSANSAKEIMGNLQKGNATPEAITGLVNQVASGKIPKEVGQALSTVKDLGDLAKIKNVSDIFKNPTVTKALENVLSKTKLPKEVTDMIGNITKIAVNPEALQQQVTQAIATAITDALKKAVPEFAKALEGLLGKGGLAKAIAGALGGGGGGDDKKKEDKKDEKKEEEGKNCTPICGAKDQCGNCAPTINEFHQAIRAHVTSEFEQHRNWLVTAYFLDNILPAMMLMSDQLATTMMQQTQIIGTFFDAKHQLETQRLFQQMTAKAHKDYHPSESLCVIGTNVRSLAASERKSNLGQLAFANRMLQRQLSNGDTLSTEGGESDRRSRVNLFIKKFCNKEDHGEALKLLCKDGGKNKKQINMDVDYTSAFENKLTLNIDFTEEGSGPATDDEENIFALGANLFGNTILPTISKELLANNSNQPYDSANLYLDVRALAAKRSVAQNSFAAITALKSEGDKEVAPFLKAILLEAGIKPDDIEARLGEKPSYFAQMEVMTKDIYQNPNFYTELYDKPVNIERKGAALQAIELMQDRDIYKSLLRSEAVLATLIETLISKEHARISRDLSDVPLKGEKFISSGGG